jgi:CBS domain containing-hemolysin-like protein
MTLIIIFLIILSAFFSGSETALFSLSRARVRRLRDNGTRTGQAVADLLAVPRKLLNTILIGNLVVNIALTSLLTVSFTEQFGPEGVGIAVVVTAVLLLIFGEITPKVLGIHRAQGFAQIAALPLKWFSVIFTPVRFVLRYVTNLILMLLRQPTLERDISLTREAFRSTLKAGKVQGGIEPNEAEIIHSISAFRTTVAREIMIPRPEMTCIEDTHTLKDALQLARSTRRHRIPVYHGNPDHITGILDLKALPSWRTCISFTIPLHRIMETTKADDTMQVAPCIRPAYVVPELRQIDSLLVEMHERGEEIAILLDEYGGTAGMISRDLIIDSLLGCMINPLPRSSLIHVRPNGDVIAAGRTRLSQLNWECSYHLPQDTDDTLAGYIMRTLGSLPVPGQSFSDNQYTFTILQMTGRRIDAVRIRKTTGAEE